VVAVRFLRCEVPGHELCVTALRHLAHCSNQAATSDCCAGIRQAARLKMLASKAADVDAVREAREDGRAPSFDHELRRELRRRGAAPAHPQPPAGQHTFQHYEAWQRPGLTPPPGEALKLLHR
jgi:hypothetical protein